MCGYELPTNLQNFTQKDFTEMKIFQKLLGGGLLFILKHPVCVVYLPRQNWMLAKQSLNFGCSHWCLQTSNNLNTVRHI